MIFGGNCMGKQNSQGGKLPYGMTGAKLANLMAIRADTGAECEAILFALFQFTEIYISHAHELVKADKKDHARDWLRFFENSRCLNLLEKAGRSVAPLRLSLAELKLAVHPLDVPSFAGDLSAIHSCLKQILSHVEKSQVEPIANYVWNNAGSPGCRDTESNNFARVPGFLLGSGVAAPSPVAFLQSAAKNFQRAKSSNGIKPKNTQEN